MNIENLKLLKQHLIDNVSQEQFDMEFYRTDEDREEDIYFTDKSNCGTVGCVLGWSILSPYSQLDLVSSDFFNFKKPRISFVVYSERVFDINQQSEIDDFLFNSNWKYIDNTVSGAIKRIDFVINNSTNIEEILEPDFYDFKYKEWYKLYNDETR